MKFMRTKIEIALIGFISSYEIMRFVSKPPRKQSSKHVVREK